MLDYKVFPATDATNKRRAFCCMFVCSTVRLSERGVVGGVC